MKTWKNAWIGVVVMACVGLFALGCRDTNTQMCLDDTAKYKGLGDKKSNEARDLLMGAMSSCAMSCKTLKKDEACPAYKELSENTCEIVGKEACQRICDTDKNEYACDKVKSM